VKGGEGGGLFRLEDLGLNLLGFCVHFWREGGREGGRGKGRMTVTGCDEKGGKAPLLSCRFCEEDEERKR